MSSERNIILLFSKLNFITKYPKRLLYFHTIISNLNCFQKDIGINFYCRAPFQLNDYPSDKYNVKKAVDYDVPHASSINDDRVYPCCGLLELEKWNVCHHKCADDIRPYRQQLLKSETAFCDICHKNCISPADFVYVCHYLLVPFVILPILLILVYVCILLKLMEVQKQQFLFFN